MAKSRYVEPNGYFSADMLKAFDKATSKDKKSTGTKKTVKKTGKKK